MSGNLLRMSKACSRSNCSKTGKEVGTHCYRQQLARVGPPSLIEAYLNNTTESIPQLLALPHLLIDHSQENVV